MGRALGLTRERGTYSLALFTSVATAGDSLIPPEVSLPDYTLVYHRLELIASLLNDIR